MKAGLKIGDVVELDFGENFHVYSLKEGKRKHKAVVLALKSSTLSEIRVGLFDDQDWQVTYITEKYRLIKLPSPIIKYKAYTALCRFIGIVIESSVQKSEMIDLLQAEVRDLRKAVILSIDAKEIVEDMVNNGVDSFGQERLKDVLALLGTGVISR